MKTVIVHQSYRWYLYVRHLTAFVRQYDEFTSPPFAVGSSKNIDFSWTWPGQETDDIFSWHRHVQANSCPSRAHWSSVDYDELTAKHDQVLVVNRSLSAACVDSLVSLLNSVEVRCLFETNYQNTQHSTSFDAMCLCLSCPLNMCSV